MSSVCYATILSRFPLQTECLILVGLNNGRRVDCKLNYIGNILMNSLERSLNQLYQLHYAYPLGTDPTSQHEVEEEKEVETQVLAQHDKLKKVADENFKVQQVVLKEMEFRYDQSYEERLFCVKNDRYPFFSLLEQGHLFLATHRLNKHFDVIYQVELNEESEIIHCLREILRKNNYLWIIEILINPHYQYLYARGKYFSDSVFDRFFSFTTENSKLWLFSFLDQIPILESYVSQIVKLQHSKEELFEVLNFFFQKCQVQKNVLALQKIAELIRTYLGDDQLENLLGNVELTLKQTIVNDILGRMISRESFEINKVARIFRYLEMGQFDDEYCYQIYEQMIIPLDEEFAEISIFHPWQEQLMNFLICLLEQDELLTASFYLRFIKDRTHQERLYHQIEKHLQQSDDLITHSSGSFEEDCFEMDEFSLSPG